MTSTTHKVTLSVQTGADGKKHVVCHPNKRVDNRLGVGETLRFEAADPANVIAASTSGAASFSAGASGGNFAEFTATTRGTFEFGGTITLPDGNVIGWEPGAGGEGEVV
jgi:hypothetical protein